MTRPKIDSATDRDPKNQNSSSLEEDGPDQTPTCRLSDSEQEARRQGLAGLLYGAAQETREVDDGFRFQYPGHPVLTTVLLDLVESERECCPFLKFELEFEPDWGPVSLTLRGDRSVKSFLSEELAQIKREGPPADPEAGDGSAVERALKTVAPIYRTSAVDGDEIGALTQAVYEQLIEMEPAKAEELSRQSGLSLSRTRELLDYLGAERNDRGQVIGLGLTLEPTAHEYRAEGQTVYTWCGPDALLYPSLLNHTAEVRSADPTNGQAIELRVSPRGVESVRPESTRVTWMRDADPDDVRGSFCRGSRFFATEETAENWAKSRDGVEILSVEEAARSIRMVDVLL